MSIELILIVGLIVLMSIILAFMYIKDKEVSTRLDRFNSIIDNTQKEIFELKNALNALKIQISQTNTKKDMSLVQNDLENKIEVKINEMQENLGSSILENKNNIASFITATNENIRLFKEKTKDFGRISSVVSSSGREDEIISLYKQSKNKSEIAKILGLGIGEVELTLNLAGVKS